LILAQDASNYISARPPPVLPKPRRTLPAAPALVGSTSGSHPEGSNHCTAPLDLDHLTSLRQTLLSAIERYDTRTKELIDRDLPSSSGGGAKSSTPAESDHQLGDSVGNTDDDNHSSDRGKPKFESNLLLLCGRLGRLSQDDDRMAGSRGNITGEKK
jgi:hypothetical protein